jgi:methanogenic corrinoid protein MtbC1
MGFTMYQNKFENLLLEYDKVGALELFNRFSLENNAIDFIDNVIVDSLFSIGEKWEKGNIALSQVYMSSKICEELIERLIPKKGYYRRKHTGIAIVTLQDQHILGKKIVSSIVRSAGFELIDYGAGVKAETVIERAIADNIKILLISVLMYPSALRVKQVTDTLHKNDPSIKIVVGGAPFSLDEDLWRRVGADAMGKTAAEGVRIIRDWMGSDCENE